MNPTLIQDCGYTLSAGQRQLFKVDCATVLAGSGLTLADFATFTLTVREDPGYPRSGATLFLQLDPANAGGTPLIQVTGTPDASPGTLVTFVVTAPANPGRHRYAFDVVGTGGDAGPVQLQRATWLDVIPTVGSMT